MKVLIRVYNSGFDKTNVSANTLEEGLKILGKELHNITSRVKWLHFEDVFFHNTKNYIRIIHN